MSRAVVIVHAHQVLQHLRDPIGALGEMRGVFGVHLARIAAQYGLDIEG